MKRGLSFLVAGVATLALLQGCALTGGPSGKRPTNVEVRIISQSCFNADIVPCG